MARLKKLHDHLIFTLHQASMHGLIHVVRSRRHIFERFLWIGLVVCAFALAIQQATEVWLRYENRPVVITVKKDYFNWEIEFPSILICLRDVDENASSVMRDAFGIEGTHDELKQYIHDVLFSNYYNYRTFVKYENGERKDFLPPEKYLTLINLLSPRIRTYKPNAKNKITIWPKDVNSTYAHTLTEFGLCHTYHGKYSKHFQIETFLGLNPNTTYQSVTKNSRDKNVFFVQNAIKHPYFFFAVAPNEVIEINYHYISSRAPASRQFSIETVQIIPDDEIKNLNPEQRNCKFEYENENLKHSPVYSYNLCKIECRIQLALQHCKCIPHYYKKLKQETICNMSGLYCLSKYPEIINLMDTKNGHNLCDCHQNCYNQEVIAQPTSNSPWFIDSNAEVDFKTFPQERYIRVLIFTKTDLLIQVGSLFGLFLGCSVLSLIELPYFLTLRLFWAVFGNRPIKVNV